MSSASNCVFRLFALLLVLAVPAGVAIAQGVPQSVSDVKAPVPTVPEVFTLMGQYVRVAYNNEGFVNLGYRIANGSVGEEWMLLEAGFSLRKGVKDFKLTRDAISVKTPDGKMIPLATQSEYADARYLPALNARLKVSHDSLNYFPPDVTRACTLRFFADLGTKGNTLSYDQTELAYNMACVGRLYFKIPGGIQTGQHWLVVKFATSTVEVPFRILTKEEDKFMKKNWDDLKKALDEGLTQ